MVNWTCGKSSTVGEDCKEAIEGKDLVSCVSQIFLMRKLKKYLDTIKKKNRIDFLRCI